jgi:hypothetical protein
MGAGSDGKSYAISATWDPTDPSFEVLNTETAKGKTVKRLVAILGHANQNLGI